MPDMPIIPSVAAGAAAAAAKDAGLDEAGQLKQAFLADTLARAKNQEAGKRAREEDGAGPSKKLRVEDLVEDESRPNPYAHNRHYPSQPGALLKVAHWLNIK